MSSGHPEKCCCNATKTPRAGIGESLLWAPGIEHQTVDNTLIPQVQTDFIYALIVNELGIDPRATPSTKKATTHVVIRPGQDWAFLLGLIKEGKGRLLLANAQMTLTLDKDTEDE